MIHLLYIIIVLILAILLYSYFKSVFSIIEGARTYPMPRRHPITYKYGTFHNENQSNVISMNTIIDTYINQYFDQKGDNLTSRDIPEDEKGVIDFIDEMIGIIELNGWHMDQGEDKKAQGRISDSAMSKLEIGIFKLYALGSPYHTFYKKKFKALKIKTFRGKYLPWILVAIVLFVGFLISANS